MIIFLGLPYQIAVATSSTDKTQLQTSIRIDDFPSFVNSKAKYEAKASTVNGIECFIGIELKKYCHKSKSYITLNSSSPGNAEFLGIYIRCKNATRNRISFSFDAIIKFKRNFVVKNGFLSRNNKRSFEAKIDVFFFYFVKSNVFELKLQIIFRIFLTSKMAIWLETHSKCLLKF